MSCARKSEVRDTRELRAARFHFNYVSPGAVELLGYPLRRWLGEPAFWVEQMVAPKDLGDAVAYCVLATATRGDHVFEYRAVTAAEQRRVMRAVVSWCSTRAVRRSACAA